MIFTEDSFLNSDYLEVPKHRLCYSTSFYNNQDSFLGKRNPQDQEIKELLRLYIQPDLEPAPLVLEIVDKPQLTVAEGSSQASTIFQYIKSVPKAKLTPARVTPLSKEDAEDDHKLEPTMQSEQIWSDAGVFEPVKKLHVKPGEAHGKVLTQEDKDRRNAGKSITRNKKKEKYLYNKARREAAKLLQSKPVTEKDIEEHSIEQGVLTSLRKADLSRRFFKPSRSQIMRNLPKNIAKYGKKPYFKIEYSTSNKEPIPHPTTRLWIYHRSPTSSTVFDRLCLELARRIQRAKVIGHAQINYCRGCHAFIYGPPNLLNKLHDFDEKFSQFFNVNAVNYRLCMRKVQANLSEDPRYYEKLEVQKLFPKSKSGNWLSSFATPSFRYELKNLDPSEVQQEIVKCMKGYLQQVGDWQRFEYSGNKRQTRQMMPLPWFCRINRSLPFMSGLVDRCIRFGKFSDQEKEQMLIEDERAKRQQQ